MSTENEDQHHVEGDEQATPPADEPTTEAQATGAEPGADVWGEATERPDAPEAPEAPEAETPAGGEEPVGDVAPAVDEPVADVSPVGEEPAPVEEPVAAEEPAVAEPAAEETPFAAEESAAEEATVVDETVVDAAGDDEAPAAEAEEEGADEPRLSAVPDEEPVVEGETVDEPAAAAAGASAAEDSARQFISSVEGFLGSVFRDASEAVDKLATKGKEQARGASRPADPAEFMESVESWVGDFFRGAPGKAAREFGRAAAGSAFKSSTNKSDDVWANATTEDSDRDASRECRYCPFCQTLAAVRNTRPDLYDQIGDTAKTLVDLVKQAAEQSKGRRPWR